MKSLLGLSLSEHTEIAIAAGLRRFAGAQITSWVYPKRATEISQMTNLSLQARESLSQNFTIARHAAVDVQTSVDGTKKYLFETTEGNRIEAVYIPDRERATLCISSQAGCRMGCKFCMTARVGFREHLSAGEIINQVMSIDESEKLTNIVYMGMGEPLDNIDNVLRSIEIMTASWGFAWSPTRITLSTIGVMPALKRFMDETKVHLAVSLHNPFDTERAAMMPMQRAYPIADVLSLLREYNFYGQRRLSFEYIMFEDVNDTERHLDELIRILRGMECRINLIRFHQIPDSPLRGSSPTTVAWFNASLNAAGITTTTRSSRGEDIFAACGMLAASSGGSREQEDRES